MVVREVWNHNMVQEVNMMSTIRNRPNFQYAFIDFEFPGFLHKTPYICSEAHYYEDLKYNVDKLKVNQLGITFSDGKDHYSWQVNFREFDSKLDLCSDTAIDFLTKSGINLEKNKKEGVDARLFGELFYDSIMEGCKCTKWITFHGSYDFGYLYKLVYQTHLPNSLPEFLEHIWNLLGNIYDVKLIAEKYEGRFGRFSLLNLAKTFHIDWNGNCHQAGHDSLLTALVFWNLKKHGMDEETYTGLLYGFVSHGEKGLEEKFPGLKKKVVSCYCLRQTRREPQILTSHAIKFGTGHQMSSADMRKAAATLSEHQTAATEVTEEGYIPKYDQLNMEKYLQHWAAQRGRTVTMDAIKGVSSAIIANENLNIKESDIEYILLGWDTRGDGILVEIQSTLTAVKEYSQNLLVDHETFKRDLQAIATQVNEILEMLMGDLQDEKKEKEREELRKIKLYLRKVGMNIDKM